MLLHQCIRITQILLALPKILEGGFIPIKFLPKKIGMIEYCMPESVYRRVQIIQYEPVDFPRVQQGQPQRCTASKDLHEGIHLVALEPLIDEINEL